MYSINTQAVDLFRLQTLQWKSQQYSSAKVYQMKALSIWGQGSLYCTIELLPNQNQNISDI